MKKIIAILLVSFYYVSLFSQQSLNTDSLENLLGKSKGNERIDLLNSISWEIKYTNPGKAGKMADEAINLSQKSQYIYGLALANKNKAAIAIIQANFAKAKPYLQKAEYYINNTNDKFNKAKIYNLTAIIFREERIFLKAIDYQKKAIEIFKEIKDTNEITGNLHNLAILNGRMNNSYEELKIYTEIINIEIARNNHFGIARTANNLAGALLALDKQEQALNYYKLAARSAKKVNNPNFESSAYHGIANIYSKKGNLKNALEFYNKAIEINIKYGFNDFLANNYFNLGDIFKTQNLLDKSNQYYIKASDLFNKIGNYQDYINANSQLSYNYILQHNIKKASEVADSIFQIAQEINSIPNLCTVHLLQFNIYKIKQQYKDALKHLELYNLYADSLRLLERENQQLELQTKFEIKNIENTNARLIAENKLQQNTIASKNKLMLIYLIGSAIILSIAVVLYIMKQRLKHINKELKQMNETIKKQTTELTDVNKTKDKLFSIIAHDLKNPFQSLIGITEIILEDFNEISKEEQIRLIRQLNQNSHTTYKLLENLLSWSLSQSGKLSPEIAETNISEIIKSETEKLSSLLLTKNISIVNECNEQEFALVDKNMLAMIIRNLVTNAVKFSYENSEILIKCSKTTTNFRIDIIDYGIGIENEKLTEIFNFKTDKSTHGTANEKGSGLGLVLCKEFVEKMGGKIQVQSTVNKGSTFSVILELKK